MASAYGFLFKHISFADSLFDKFPFFLPCLLHCAALLLTVVLAYFYLPETLVTR